MSNPFPPRDPFPPAGQPPSYGGGSPFGQQQPPPPFGDPSGQPQLGAYGVPPSRLSLLALASLLLGCAGVVMCCCYPAAIPAALAAVVTGHAALIFINRSGSTLTGKPLAALGLVTGYLGLLAAGGMLFVALTADRDADVQVEQSVTAASVLDGVEDKIRTDNEGIAHGNSDEAIALARSYSETILKLREELFTKREGGISLSGKKFITYCELRPGQCAFVVHVPEYRKFDDDAKESLAELAWLVAQQTVAEKLQPGDKLAVGLKGVVLYGSVMVGKVADPEGEEDGLESQGDDRAALQPFFEPEDSADEPADAPAELPQEH